jgi:hypothetical protein
MRISAQDKTIVEHSFGVLDDDIAITYLCDVMQPPLPPPDIPPDSPTNRVEPFEPLSALSRSARKCSKCPLRSNANTPEMRALTHVSTELTHGMEPHEPLSARDQVVAEMRIAPCTSDVPRHHTNSKSVRKCSKCPLHPTVDAFLRCARSRPHRQR